MAATIEQLPNFTSSRPGSFRGRGKIPASRSPARSATIRSAMGRVTTEHCTAGYCFWKFWRSGGSKLKLVPSSHPSRSKPLWPVL
jgi:hypothetical protein